MPRVMPVASKADVAPGPRMAPNTFCTSTTA
jgi:hypothetical protein